MATRQAAATARKLAHPRYLHSSTPKNASATLISPSEMLEENVEEIFIKPIFDIFDAPSRLGESSRLIRKQTKSQSSYNVLPETSSASAESQINNIPTSLPPPIIFDGPARPKNIPTAFQNVHHALRSSSSNINHHTPSVAFHDLSTIPVEIFDGPARITRYHHRSSNESSSLNPYLLLGIAGAIGCATVAKNVDFTVSPSGIKTHPQTI